MFWWIIVEFVPFYIISSSLNALLQSWSIENAHKHLFTTCFLYFENISIMILIYIEMTMTSFKYNSVLFQIIYRLVKLDCGWLLNKTQGFALKYFRQKWCNCLVDSLLCPFHSFPLFHPILNPLSLYNGIFRTMMQQTKGTLESVTSCLRSDFMRRTRRCFCLANNKTCQSTHMRSL